MDGEKAAARLADAGGIALLGEGRHIGLEREALRVDANAGIARTPHPPALGSALTHPHITTDYSEALLELITPPLPNSDAAVAFLEDIHTYIYRHLDNEILWANSMPCVMKDDDSIPLARYGYSNIGRMKTIYRRGLGYRYGRAMQTISGVHFNYSFNLQLWPCLREAGFWSAARNGSEQAFRSHGYMALIRNLLRVGWVVPYLFGASPAVCRAFAGSLGQLSVFDAATLFGPAATSLRMGDIGYQNNQESEAGIIEVSYDSLDEYVGSLKRAVTTPHEHYRRFGVKVNGEFQQLNANILQIENEYYATARPKHTSGKEEMPLLALHDSGVEYIELRSLDIGAFDRAGVNAGQLDFLEALFLFCLLADSPPLDLREQRESNRNEVMTAHEGRTRGLELSCAGRPRRLSEWGRDLCDRMTPACELLDRANNTDRYTRSLARQTQLFEDAEATPAARMITEMRDRGESFVAFAHRKSCEFGELFKSRPLDDAQLRRFDELAKTSENERAGIEAADRLPLDKYIKDYFAQLSVLDGAGA